MARTERGQYRFTIKQDDGGRFFIAVEPVKSGTPKPDRSRLSRLNGHGVVSRVATEYRITAAHRRDDGQPHFGRRYDRQLADIFAVQDERERHGRARPKLLAAEGIRTETRAIDDLNSTL